MIVKVFSGQETAKNVKQLLKQYRTLKRTKDPLINEIDAAVNKLSQYEQTLIKQRYLSVEQFSVTKIAMNVYYSKTKVHEDLNNAMIQFAEVFRDGELMKLKEFDSEFDKNVYIVTGILTKIDN